MRGDRRGRPRARRWSAPLGVLAVGVALAGVPTPEAGAPPAPLTFAGSGTNLAITRLLAEAFARVRPDVRIEVPASIGSSGGIRAAAEGAIAAGLVSRPLRDAETGLGVTVVPYARTAVVIGVHPSVAEDSITTEELLAIYRRVKTRWRDGQEIVVLTREPGDSGIDVLARALPGFRAAYEESQRAHRWTTLYTDQEMNRLLAKTPHAIGLSDLGALRLERLPVKPLRLDGVAPTPENVVRGRYRLVKALAFVFRAPASAPAQAFIDFVRSKAGQRLLRTNAYLPPE